MGWEGGGGYYNPGDVSGGGCNAPFISTLFATSKKIDNCVLSNRGVYRVFSR